MSDQLVRAISKDGLSRPRRCPPVFDGAARQIHKTLPVATAALGRVLAAASMMGNALKDEGS